MSVGCLGPALARDAALALRLAAAAEGACFPAGDAHQLQTADFAIAYGDAVGAELAQRASGWLQASLDAQRDMGWPAPTGLDAYRVAVVLSDDALGGAATSLQPCDGQRLPVIVVGRDVFDDLAAAEQTLAHEVNHVLQLAASEGPELWFAEATAVWMQGRVPGGDAWASWAPTWTSRTHLSLFDDRRDDPERFLSMYGRVVWVRHLDEAWGGADVVRDVWLGAPDAPRRRVDQGALLEGVGLDLVEVHAAFVLALATGDIGADAGVALPTPAARVAVPGEVTVPEEIAPASWGLSVVALDVPAGEGVAVTAALEDGADWLALLVRQVGDDVATAPLVDGEATLGAAPGAAFSVLLAPRAALGRTWSWTVAAVPAPAGDRPDDPADPAPTCGCAHAPALPAWGCGLLLLRRRRASTVAAAGAS